MERSGHLSDLSQVDSVFHYYQKLIRLRHENPVIVYGVFEPLMEDSEAVYAYRRILDDKILVVACNWTDRDQDCNLFDHADGIEIISNYDLHRMGILQPYEARVVLITIDG